jgi:hypothetical protein
MLPNKVKDRMLTTDQMRGMGTGGMHFLGAITGLWTTDHKRDRDINRETVNDRLVREFGKDA